MRIKNPITVYTLYACNEFRDTASYGRQFMITDLHNYYKRTLVQEALELIDDEDLQDFEGMKVVTFIVQFLTLKRQLNLMLKMLVTLIVYLWLY